MNKSQLLASNKFLFSEAKKPGRQNEQKRVENTLSRSKNGSKNRFPPCWQPYGLFCSFNFRYPFLTPRSGPASQGTRGGEWTASSLFLASPKFKNSPGGPKMGWKWTALFVQIWARELKSASIFFFFFLIFAAFFLQLFAFSFCTLLASIFWTRLVIEIDFAHLGPNYQLGESHKCAGRSASRFLPGQRKFSRRGYVTPWVGRFACLPPTSTSWQPCRRSTRRSATCTWWRTPSKVQ